MLDIKNQRARDLKDLQNRIYFIHITKTYEQLKKELNLHINYIYVRLYLLDNYLTDNSFGRDDKLDAEALLSLPLLKKCYLKLSVEDNLQPSFIKIDILEGSVDVIGDPYYIKMFEELRALV